MKAKKIEKNAKRTALWGLITATILSFFQGLVLHLNGYHIPSSEGNITLVWSQIAVMMWIVFAIASIKPRESKIDKIWIYERLFLFGFVLLTSLCIFIGIFLDMQGVALSFTEAGITCTAL